jgi:hypothetical protein
MKGDSITVRLDDDLLPSSMKRAAAPFAEARGYLTDEDVFNTVS